MNIEQFKARWKNKAATKTLNVELQKVSQELEQESAAIKVMISSQGWRFVKDFMERTIKLYKDTLAVLNPANPIDIMRVQEGISAREALLLYIENKGNM